MQQCSQPDSMHAYDMQHLVQTNKTNSTALYCCVLMLCTAAAAAVACQHRRGARTTAPRTPSSSYKWRNASSHGTTSSRRTRRHHTSSGQGSPCTPTMSSSIQSWRRPTPGSRQCSRPTSWQRTKVRERNQQNQQLLVTAGFRQQATITSLVAYAYAYVCMCYTCICSTRHQLHHHSCTVLHGVLRYSMPCPALPYLAH